ncbi:MAG: hypothetical protein JWN98_119 [Abditibacteriota bacterium]|nr:hypothetical protein [Abditibacteriota bacterium]
MYVLTSTLYTINFTARLLHPQQEFSTSAWYRQSPFVLDFTSISTRKGKAAEATFPFTENRHSSFE